MRESAAKGFTLTGDERTLLAAYDALRAERENVRRLIRRWTQTPKYHRTEHAHGLAGAAQELAAVMGEPFDG